MAHALVYASDSLGGALHHCHTGPSLSPQEEEEEESEVYSGANAVNEEDPEREGGGGGGGGTPLEGGVLRD